MPKQEFFIVVDIESAGPSPHAYAMLSLGASTITNPKLTFYIELIPDHPDFTEEAMQVNNLTMEDLAHSGTLPEQGMQQFADWVTQVTPPGSDPVFVAFNAPYDWMFVNHYLHKYLGYNLFGHKALDIKALFMGVHNTSFADTSHHQIAKHYNMVSTLSHHALEDAVQEADLLKRLLTDIEKAKENE